MRASLPGKYLCVSLCVCRGVHVFVQLCVCAHSRGCERVSRARQGWPLCPRVDKSGKSADSEAQPQRRPCVRTARDSRSLARPSPFAPPSPPPPFWRDTTQLQNGDRKKGWGRAADCNSEELRRVERVWEGQAERGSGENWR